MASVQRQWDRFRNKYLDRLGAHGAGDSRDRESLELSRRGLDSSISFEARGAGDLQGRARAYQSLTGGGTVGADARRIVGVE